MSGSDETSKNITTPYVKGEFQKHFSNTIEREVKIKNDTFIINTERVAILPETSRHIGNIEIKEDFILENNKIYFQISTEDSVEHFVYEGKEIIE